MNDALKNAGDDALKVGRCELHCKCFSKNYRVFGKNGLIEKKTNRTEQTFFVVVVCKTVHFAIVGALRRARARTAAL